jgi:hypothetical protein
MGLGGVQKTTREKCKLCRNQPLSISMKHGNLKNNEYLDKT